MRRGGYLIAVVVALGVAAGVVWRVRAVDAKAAAARITVPTAAITEGPLVVTLPANGVLESAQEIPVCSEIAGNLIEICPDNTPVTPGDVVFRLDTKELVDQEDQLARGLTDAQEALITAKSDGEVRVTQATADADAAREALKLAQEKAQAERDKIAAQVKFAEGETARAERELARAQRLAKLNYIPGTKLRDAEKAYRAQQFALEQQKAMQADTDKRTAEQVQNQQSALDLALHTLETAKADAQENLEDARIKVAEAKRKLVEIEKKIRQCTVVAPAAGLAVIETNTENWPERRPYRLGDQVGARAAPVKIYDFKRMQVRCQIGEMDVTRVKAAQEVFVSAPSLAGRRYRGKIAMVEELAHESNVWQGGAPGKKVFGVLVTLGETEPAQLRPGMTVDLEIVLGNVPKAMTAPIRAVFKENGRPVVYRARDDAFERVPVTTGTRNDLRVELRGGGLRAGDRVALERPPLAALRRMEGA
jgi:HlyD family secretion protein/macrolide-specific efflux system membrane fusion protein